MRYGYELDYLYPMYLRGRRSVCAMVTSWTTCILCISGGGDLCSLWLRAGLLVSYVSQGEEIFVRYGYELDYCPDWYLEAWEKGNHLSAVAAFSKQ